MTTSLKLAGLTGLPRYRLADAEVAVLKDDVADQDGVRLNYDLLLGGLDRRRWIVDALGERLRAEPAPPPPTRTSLSDVACRACARVSELRQGGRRSAIDTRIRAVGRIRTLLVED